jgi:hypothetical protein
MGTLHPADGLRSRFSARHGVAVGLRFGRAGLAEFSDAAATAPEVARLRGLITLDPDPGVARDAAVLRIETRSADPVEVRTEHTRGSIARPLTDDELQDKVQALVTPVLGDGAADRIRSAVDELPGVGDVSGLLTALRPSVEAPGLGVFTASSRHQKAAPNDAASHPRRPAPTPTQDSATDRLLALAGQPASTLPAVTALARFTAAVTAQQGIAAARALLRALRPVDGGDLSPAQAGHLRDADDRPASLAGRPGSAALPAGPALTAWVTGAAAVAAPAPAMPSADGMSQDSSVAMVVCAAARALGDDCLAAVAAGLEAAALVESVLDRVAGPGWSVPTVAAGIGAGLAAGVMLGLPEDQLRNALGVCATQAAGLRAAAGTEAGPLQAGKAACNAVEAALLAREGFTGPAEPLGGRRGLFALFSAS